MEPPKTTDKTKTPPFSRSIAWLGGASFGRSRRPEETTPTPRRSEGQVTLLLLFAAFVFLFQGCDLDKAMHTLVASVLLILVGVVWLRCYHRIVHPYLRA